MRNAVLSVSTAFCLLAWLPGDAAALTVRTQYVLKSTTGTAKVIRTGGAYATDPGEVLLSVRLVAFDANNSVLGSATGTVTATTRRFDVIYSDPTRKMTGYWLEFITKTPAGYRLWRTGLQPY